MFSKRLLFVLICEVVAGNLVKGQKIVYSEPDREDNRRMTFEVVGKISGNFLVYKNIRNKNWITVFGFMSLSKTVMPFMFLIFLYTRKFPLIFPTTSNVIRRLSSLSGSE